MKLTSENVESALKALKETMEYKLRKGQQGMMLAYIDSRQAQDRLDDVVGGESWQTRHHVKDGYVWCELGIKIDGEWIWKSDSSDHTKEYQWQDEVLKNIITGEVVMRKKYNNSDPEPVIIRKDGSISKSQFSDSFKRACVHWGIGRFLYDLDTKALPKPVTYKGSDRKASDKQKKKIWAMACNITNSNDPKEILSFLNEQKQNLGLDITKDLTSKEASNLIEKLGE